MRLTGATPGHAFARGAGDYVADLLLSEIEPETVAALREDGEFLRAYHYPFPAYEEGG